MTFTHCQNKHVSCVQFLTVVVVVVVVFVVLNLVTTCEFNPNTKLMQLDINAHMHAYIWEDISFFLYFPFFSIPKVSNLRKEKSPTNKGTKMV